MDRRLLLMLVLSATAVAIGFGLNLGAADAAVPLPPADRPLSAADLLQRSQVIILDPRRGRQRWVCGWQGGRRVCGRR
jgi:hypothetical protein